MPVCRLGKSAIGAQKRPGREGRQNTVSAERTASFFAALASFDAVNQRQICFQRRTPCRHPNISPRVREMGACVCL